MKRKKILTFLKNNWGSTLTLTLATVSALVGFFMTDDKWTLKALSISVGLIAGNLFLLIGKHLESIQSALKDIKSSGSEGVRLKKQRSGMTSQLIAGAKEELFFTGAAMADLISERKEIFALPEKVRIRLLVTDFNDEILIKNRSEVYGRPPAFMFLNHLDIFSSKQNFEIRTVNFLLITYYAAKDMHTKAGYIQVSFPNYGESGRGYPRVELTPTDVEWYEHYKTQIELLWAQGTPWPPSTKEGT